MLKRDFVDKTVHSAHKMVGYDPAHPRYWETAYRLIEDGFLPPVALATHLQRPKRPSLKHIVVLDALIEALKVCRYRAEEQRTRLTLMRKDLRLSCEASASSTDTPRKGGAGPQSR